MRTLDDARGARAGESRRERSGGTARNLSKCAAEAGSDTPRALIMAKRRRTWNIVSEARRYWKASQRWGEQWATGREMLIELCARSHHDDVNATVSKLWLIGRSHSAALERSHVPGPPGVYLRAAAGVCAMCPSLDFEFARLRRLKASGSTFRERAASCVDRLATQLSAETGQYKISLASKYVHYHVCSVPIYDSISASAFRALDTSKVRGLDYSSHVARFQSIVDQLTSVGFEGVDARSVDDFVMWWWT